MQELRFFEVLQNADRNEGRGPMLSTGIAFTSEEEARKFVRTDYYAHNYGVQGTHGSNHDVKMQVLFVYNSVSEANTKLQNTVKERALKKLTREEREALGLD